ncbi:MAG TPA: DUF1598 domain-containing protein [Thermoguttaceae bacterium]|nr:DUF1598 domain-containing protein [Thermoguttaceae bacterium]
MQTQLVKVRWGIVLGLAAVLGTYPSWVYAQRAAGVVVDAQGVLHKKVVSDPTGQLMRERQAAAKASLSAELARFSKRRYISLTRLEQALADRQGVLTDEMRYLAGLLRVQYVFYYPETKDIVIAGPAEGWMEDPAGRIVGISTQRPVCQLEDLVVALRLFGPDKKKSNPVISCSIDPTPEGLAAMQRVLRQMGSQLPGPPTPAIANQIASSLQESLGLQDITINGVPAETHFAHVLVEADYRMKLIGIGLEEPPVQMASFVQMVNPGQVSRNALFRWFFVPDYQCVRVSEDGLAMKLEGDGVKLVGEDELVTSEGSRQTTGAASRASQMFTTTFTKKYPELAERSPVFAQLRNLIDMTVAAAFIQQQDYYTKAGWKMEIFGDESKLAVQKYPAPKKVAPAVSAVVRGARLMTPIGGGVHIEPQEALEKRNLLPDDKGEVAKTRQEVQLRLPQGRWWWD